MPPSPYSLLLASTLPTAPYGQILDVGTGSGVISILLAMRGAQYITATDLSPKAIETAKLNARLNNVEHIHFELADMFPDADAKFDLIVCNPPSIPMMARPDGAEGLFYYAGPFGADVIDRLIEAAPRFMTEDGSLYFVNTSLVSIDRTINKIRECGLEFEIAAKEDLEFRPHYLEHLPWFETLAAQGRSHFYTDNGILYETLYILRIYTPETQS